MSAIAVGTRPRQPTGATFEERLESVAAAVLQWILAGDSIGLMRVAIAESPRFPDLASSVYAMARERGAQASARLLAETAQSEELGTLPAFAPELHENNDAILPRSGPLPPDVASAVRGEARATVCGD
jgi:hypothetical protein